MAAIAPMTMPTWIPRLRVAHSPRVVLTRHVIIASFPRKGSGIAGGNHN